MRNKYEFNVTWYNKEGYKDPTIYAPYPRTYSEALNQVFQYLNYHLRTGVDPYLYKYFEPILEEDDENVSV